MPVYETPHMTLATGCAAVMLGALVVYALLAGADFRGGIWDLLARGRCRAERPAAPLGGGLRRGGPRLPLPPLRPRGCARPLGTHLRLLQLRHTVRPRRRDRRHHFGAAALRRRPASGRIRAAVAG